MLCLSRLILCFIEVKVRKLKKTAKMKDEVKGEQGLAALALGKFEELYNI